MGESLIMSSNSVLPEINRNSNFFELTNYLKIYHDFAYFLCISPFRLVFIRFETESGESVADGEFQVKRWWPHVLFCGVLTTLGLTWFLADIRMALPGGNSWKVTQIRNPSVYFAVMLSIVGSLLKMAVIRVFWTRHNGICKVVNFLKLSNQIYLQNSRTVQEEEGKKLRKTNTLIFLVCLVYTGLALANWVVGRGLTVACYEGPLLTKWTMKWWWQTVVNASRYNVFMETEFYNATVEGGPEPEMALDTFFGVIGALGYYYRRVLGSHCNCFLLMAVLTLWKTTKQFANQLAHKPSFCQVFVMETAQSNQNGVHNNNSLISWNQIYQRYLIIKQLTKLINSVYSLNVTMFLVEAVLYYAISFDDIFIEHSKDNDVTKVIRLLFYFGSTCAVSFTTADVSHLMTSSFKEWLSIQENRRKIPLDQLYMILNELDTNAIAVKGSNVFPVTYSLAAKLLGATVTYFVICVQV